MELQVQLDWKVINNINLKEANMTKNIDNENAFWTPNTSVTNADCTGLMGCKITVNHRNGSDVGIIAGADPYIGISVVAEDDPKKVLFCLSGPYSPAVRKVFLRPGSDKIKAIYNRYFPIVLKHFVEAATNGELNSEELMLELEAGSSSIGNGCPFGV